MSELTKHETQGLLKEHDSTELTITHTPPETLQSLIIQTQYSGNDRELKDLRFKGIEAFRTNPNLWLTTVTQGQASLSILSDYPIPNIATVRTIVGLLAKEKQRIPITYIREQNTFVMCWNIHNTKIHHGARGGDHRDTEMAALLVMGAKHMQQTKDVVFTINNEHFFSPPNFYSLDAFIMEENVVVAVPSKFLSEETKTLLNTFGLYGWKEKFQKDQYDSFLEKLLFLHSASKVQEFGRANVHEKSVVMLAQNLIDFNVTTDQFLSYDLQRKKTAATNVVSTTEKETYSWWFTPAIFYDPSSSFDENGDILPSKSKELLAPNIIDEFRVSLEFMNPENSLGCPKSAILFRIQRSNGEQEYALVFGPNHDDVMQIVNREMCKPYFQECGVSSCEALYDYDFSFSVDLSRLTAKSSLLPISARLTKSNSVSLGSPNYAASKNYNPEQQAAVYEDSMRLIEQYIHSVNVHLDTMIETGYPSHRNQFAFRLSM